MSRGLNVRGASEQLRNKWCASEKQARRQGSEHSDPGASEDRRKEAQ